MGAANGGQRRSSFGGGSPGLGLMAMMSMSTWRAEDEQSVVMDQIAAGQRLLRRIRWRVGGVMVALAVASGIAFEIAHYTLLRRYSEERCVTRFQDHVIWVSNDVSQFLRFASLGFAPLADDIRFTRIIVAVDVLVVSFGVIQVAAFWNNKAFRAMKEMHKFTIWVYIGANVFFVVGMLSGFRFRDALTMQRHMWKVLRIWLSILVPFAAMYFTEASWKCGSVTAEVWCFPVQCSALYFVSQPQLRASMQASLNSLFEAHSARRAAAGIAGLVGDCSVKRVLQQAAGRFRSVRLADIAYEDMATNRPDPALFSRTVATKLNECDAFISHSWHDDARAKWAALQQWRADFLAAHGREPTVWLDKFCIDQDDIDANLRCLPIFLSGCQTLVVFCGVTYLSRLWCIMELFTFFHMGRGVDRIEFAYVARGEDAQHDVELINEGFGGFDANDCTCFQAQDKGKMLGIIHAAFGCLDEFNGIVQQIFASVGWRESDRYNDSAGDTVSDDEDSRSSAGEVSDTED